MADAHFPARFWHQLEDGRFQCDICPRDCKLHDGQRGLCFVRKREGDKMVLTTYGRSSGFCVDPVEKKPLNHFYPGSSVLSFGTSGCNLTCKFCQNWDISKSREFDRLTAEASPEDIARTAIDTSSKSIAYTYNDPVIFLEYATDTAKSCRKYDINSIAVTAGYIHPNARHDFFEYMDAANIDLKGFTEGFYHDLCTGHLQPVLDTLVYLRHETDVWFEITTLLIPGRNDSNEEISNMSEWLLENLGPDVPLHFSAFHPDWKMRDVPATPPSSLRRARAIAMEAGLHYVYTGNVHDPDGGTTYCPACKLAVIVRDWYEIPSYRLDAKGHCPNCGYAIPGRFEAFTGAFGHQRIPVTI